MILAQNVVKYFNKLIKNWIYELDQKICVSNRIWKKKFKKNSLWLELYLYVPIFLTRKAWNVYIMIEFIWIYYIKLFKTINNYRVDDFSINFSVNSTQCESI